MIDRFLSRAGPRGLLVSGETGIGKSRLGSEAITRAERLGYQVFRSACFENDRSLPYAPLLDLLRALFAVHPSSEMLTPLGTLAESLVGLLPELEGARSGSSPLRGSDPEQEKGKLFQALTRLLSDTASIQPLLVVVEDLHWCDDNSLEFLLYLMRRLASQPLLLLMTCRSDEVHPGLDYFLSALDRERLASEVELSRLNTVEVGAMLQEILQVSRVQTQVVESIYSLTDGNPYFIEEVLKSLAASGAVPGTDSAGESRLAGRLEIPRGLANMAQRRLSQLSADARNLATIAAVAGRRFDFSLLQALTVHTEEQLIEIVKELIAEQLVAEESEERFAFRHALTREAICAGLLARERRAIHLRIGDALESLYGSADDASIWELAYHFYEGGRWEKAAAYSERAGRRALGLHASRAAIEHLTHAIVATENTAGNAPLELYLARGIAYQTLGDFECARSNMEAVLNMAMAARDQNSEWTALINLGFLWAGRDYNQAGTLFHQALELAQSMSGQAILGHSLNRLGNWHLNTGRPQVALGYHRQALSSFQRLGDREGAAEALDLMGMACFLGGDLIQAVDCCRQVIEIFTELDNPVGLVSSLTTLCTVNNIYHGGIAVPVDMDSSECLRAGERALEIARGMDWSSGEACTMFSLAAMLASYGSYARSLDLGVESLAIATEIEHRQWMAGAATALGAIHLDLMAFPHAVEYLEKAVGLSREVGSVHWLHMAAGHLASAFIRQGSLDRARSLLAEYATGDSGQTIVARLLLRSQAELALAQGDGARALEIAHQLIASAPGASRNTAYGLLMLRGEALTLLRRFEEAEEALKASLSVAVRMGFLPVVWRVHVSLGKVYRAMSRRTDSMENFSRARTVIYRIAPEIQDEVMRDSFLKQAARTMPPGSLPSSRQAARNAFGGLTARERDVTRLVAQGMTNRQIAATLVIGERTVETHVSNIMSKLGFNSRSQITSWAFEKGLADTSK